MKEEERRPIVHDPDAKVDLTGNTVAASLRVKYRIDVALESAIQQLYGEGLPRDDKGLFWSLVGQHLKRYADRIEESAIGAGNFLGDHVWPDTEGVWRCDNCGNVNPPQAEVCLTDCSNKVVVVDKSAKEETVGHPSPGSNGNGSSKREAL